MHYLTFTSDGHTRWVDCPNGKWQKVHTIGGGRSTRKCKHCRHYEGVTDTQLICSHEKGRFAEMNMRNPHKKEEW